MTPLAAGQSISAGQTDPNRVGVVFVHGIGTQAACETFLDWSAPIEKLLSDWRLGHDAGVDPIVRCDYDLSGTRLPILELAVPEHHDGNLTWPARTWVMTESWWAATTLPPGLGFMISYTRRAVKPIIRGILHAYQLRMSKWEVRRTNALAGATAAGSEYRPLVLSAVKTGRDWINALDAFQMILSFLVFPLIVLVASPALVLYGLFRSIPIQRLKDLGVLKSADEYLTRWFGGLPDVADDPLQSANVRTRLVTAIRALRDRGCGRIVIVAHSGGAIVSFSTLCDPAYLTERVDMLITIGEGLALAWRIDDAYSGLPRGSRLLGDLTALRPELRWVDFWSSYDPAPAGPLQPPPGVRVTYEPHMTVNRMSILEDHGSYWENDEEFLIPLIQHLDMPTGDPKDSRFFRDVTLETVRLGWRRKRVAELALWRWFATLGGVFAIGVPTAWKLTGRAGPERLGSDVANWVAKVPGYELVAQLLGIPAQVVSALAWLTQAVTWASWVPVLLEWFLGSAIIAVPFLVIGRIGVSRWKVWDLKARQESHSRIPTRPGGIGWRLTFVALTVITAAMILGVFAALSR